MSKGLADGTDQMDFEWIDKRLDKAVSEEHSLAIRKSLLKSDSNVQSHLFNIKQDGLNDLTVQEYFDNRERYLKEGRSKEGTKAQKAARRKVLEDKTRELILSGDAPDVAEKKAKEWMEEQAALHDPDQIAGGDPTKISGMGDRRVNSSLGSQWKTRIDAMDEQIRKLAAGLSPEELKTTYLNINLSY
ncbi:polymorphic toxin type 15 domain-containing protein [Streptococcus gordonii]|uniref:polymorphic toxin type 15 domain-containing protein n=1 Tax=Streptococcus gordonii TaxID=1302 RepID=UPI001C8BEC9F|nr:polymorphic toxin type 15 domain-containing protein [Streptococcus gordonii]